MCYHLAKCNKLEVAPCIELLAEFQDIGAELAQSHTPPKYGARNSHISQMVLDGQDGYQTVRLVLASKPFFQKGSNSKISILR